MSGDDAHAGAIVLDLDVEDDDKAGLAEQIWETARGRKNRIAISAPHAVEERELSEKGLLLPDDLVRFDPANHTFWRLSFGLTLLPDGDCRFKLADILVRIGEPTAPVGAPLIVRLSPEDQTTRRSVKRSSSSGAKASASMDKLVAGELQSSRSDQEEFVQVDLHVGRLGAGTGCAGWRIKATAVAEIPVSLDDLTLLVVVPKVNLSGRNSRSRRPSRSARDWIAGSPRCSAALGRA